jgi:pimeloyl-ACP methyl ester carboxylesterase
LGEPQRQTAGRPGTVQANGLSVYYEEWGAGEPLVLLHGATVTHAMWASVIPDLAAQYRVIAPDLRGHGRTNNPAEAFSYRLLAEDTAALVEALGLEQPHLCGWSDGGQIALEVGMRFPSLPRSLIVGAAQYSYPDHYQAAMGLMGFMAPGVVLFDQTERAAPGFLDMVRQLHCPTHGPGYEETLLTQLCTMYLTPLNYTRWDFSRIIRPTLVIVGDRDWGIPLEEAVGMYRQIPLAELAVISRGDHALPTSRPALFAATVLDFLERLNDVPPDVWKLGNA